MTDSQFHSYRFNDQTDPTDEQLAELMRQAAPPTSEHPSEILINVPINSKTTLLLHLLPTSPSSPTAL